MLGLHAGKFDHLQDLECAGCEVGVPDHEGSRRVGVRCLDDRVAPAVEETVDPPADDTDRASPSGDPISRSASPTLPAHAPHELLRCLWEHGWRSPLG